MSKASYFSFLTEKVYNSNLNDAVCYELLSVPFTWDENIITDANRADDGLSLRSLFYYDEHDISGMCDSPCSVLEMLVAMSIRIEMDIMGEPGDDHPGRWFELMMKNLRIGRYTPVNDALMKIDIWLHREYEANGVGSLFPLREFPGDQRDLPIWDQMSFYLSERRQ